MLPPTPGRADRMHAALTFVLDRIERDDATTIIEGLIEHHGASRRFVQGTHVLRCAGVSSSNTGNIAKLLLDGWRRNAVVRLSTFI